MSPPIALRDDELHEVLQADRMVPHDLRQVYLERLAVELRGREILGCTRSCLPGRPRGHMGRRASGDDSLSS